MSVDIESPKTRGDYFWAAEVEAKKLRSKEYVESLGPSIKEYLDGLMTESGPDVNFKPVYNQLVERFDDTSDKIQGAFVGATANVFAMIAGEQAVKDFKYAAAEKLANERIEATAVTTLFRRKKIEPSFYTNRMLGAGFNDSEADRMFKATQPYPSIQELIRYGRYESDGENPKSFVGELYRFEIKEWGMWEWLSRQKLSTEQVQTLYRRKDWDKIEATTELARLAWPLKERDNLLNLAYELPNAMLLIQGDLFQEASQKDMMEDIARAGIHPDYAEKYFDGVLTKPNTQDLIEYQLRLDPSLVGLDDELRKTGIHPSYFNVYKTLAHPIPPIQDLITMAVREAFTPEIASRFGQYEGLPAEYVEAAGKKGLTKEWAERYWAAHWTLPSVQQGFGMLHRGIINQADLGLLMRALDIMPFWRDKLMQLSYKPLTRVDVRRMHLLGTLDEGGVKQAYQDVGYNDRNANLMTDFTVRYNRRSLAGFTPRDALSAYINQFIEAGQTTSILRDIGVKGAEIPNMMRLAGYKREWKYKTERIAAIGNLYKKGKYDFATARSKLSQVGLSGDTVKTQLQQWEPSAEAERTATFTNAQTLKMFTMGLIDENRARSELQLLGYNDERRDLLILSTKEQKG